MKILFVGPDLSGLGGVQNYYCLVLPYLTDDAEYLATGRMARKQRLSFVQLLIDLRLFRGRLRECDVVVFNPTLGARCFCRDIPFILLARWKRRRVVVFFRGWGLHFEQKIDRWFKPLFQWVFRHVDATIVLASQFEQKLRQWGYQGTVYRETTVMNDAWFDADEKREPNDSGPVKILFLSRVEADKGIYEMADGMAQLTEIPFECHFAGDGDEMESFRRYVKEKNYGFIKFKGYLRGEEKRRAYQEADIFILPSSHGEGMPNALLEAMGCGLSVVVTRVGGVADFFEDGRMGSFLNEVTADEIAKVLRRMIGDKDKRISVAVYNRDYAQKHFGASQAAERLRRICESVAQPEEKKV